MSKNPLFCNGEENENVIQNPHADPDHRQKLTSSRGSPLANACQAWLTSVSAFVSYPVYRMTERSHNLGLVGGGHNDLYCLSCCVMIIMYYISIIYYISWHVSESLRCYECIVHRFHLCCYENVTNNLYPLPPHGHISDVMLVWRSGNIDRTVSVLQYCLPL